MRCSFPGGLGVARLSNRVNNPPHRPLLMQPPQAALRTLSSGFRSTEQPAKWYLQAPDYFYATICILGQAWRAAAAQGIPRQVVTAGQLGPGPARDCPEDAASVSRGPLRATWCPAPPPLQP